MFLNCTPRTVGQSTHKIRVCSKKIWKSGIVYTFSLSWDLEFVFCTVSWLIRWSVTSMRDNQIHIGDWRQNLSTWNSLDCGSPVVLHVLSPLGHRTSSTHSQLLQFIQNSPFNLSCSPIIYERPSFCEKTTTCRPSSRECWARKWKQDTVECHSQTPACSKQYLKFHSCRTRNSGASQTRYFCHCPIYFVPCAGNKSATSRMNMWTKMNENSCGCVQVIYNLFKLGTFLSSQQATWTSEHT